MSAIEQLKEKISSLKASYLVIVEENQALKDEIGSVSHVDDSEVEKLKQELSSKDSEIKTLKEEIVEKDTEIEAIIAKVEALLA